MARIGRIPPDGETPDGTPYRVVQARELTKEEEAHETRGAAVIVLMLLFGALITLSIIGFYVYPWLT